MIENYINKINYDLIKYFNYRYLESIPKIKILVISFTYKRPTIKLILKSLLAIEIITGLRGNIVTTKKSNISLNIRKGEPVGCKVILRKKEMLMFLSRLFLVRIYKFKSKSTRQKTVAQNITCNARSLSFNYNALNLFHELEQHYFIFKDLGSINFTLITNSKNFTEFNYLLKSLKYSN